MSEQKRADQALRRDLPEAKVTPEMTAEAKELVKPYEPTATERRALEAHRDRRRRRNGRKTRTRAQVRRSGASPISDKWRLAKRRKSFRSGPYG
jgi:hypothetical protein